MCGYWTRQLSSIARTWRRYVTVAVAADTISVHVHVSICGTTNVVGDGLELRLA